MNHKESSKISRRLQRLRRPFCVPPQFQHNTFSLASDISEVSCDMMVKTLKTFLNISQMKIFYEKFAVKNLINVEPKTFLLEFSEMSERQRQFQEEAG